MPASTYTLLFLIFMAISLFVQLWLSWRQSRHVAAHSHQVPEAFSSHINLEAHQRAARYTLAKILLGRIELLFGTALLLAWTLGGGLDLLDSYWRTWQWGAEWTGSVLFLSLLLISGLLDLPFDYYRTFKLEARFGFNRITLQTWLGDKFKETLLMLLLGMPLLWVVLSLMESAGQLWWLQVWLVWSAFMLLMMWIFPTLIAPLFNKFTPMEEGALKQRIEALMQRIGFTSKGLFVMDGSKRSSHGNAYFTGFGKNKRVVFFDTLLQGLSDPEVEAVLAHELGHFHHHHIRNRLLLTLCSTLAALAFLGWIMQQPGFYQGLGVTRPSTYMALLLFMLTAPVITFLLHPLAAALSRRDEFQADAFAATHTSSNALITALVGMYRDNAATLTPDPLHSAFYDSHPPAPIRIAHLQQLASH